MNRVPQNPRLTKLCSGAARTNDGSRPVFSVSVSRRPGFLAGHSAARAACISELQVSVLGEPLLDTVYGVCGDSLCRLRFHPQTRAPGNARTSASVPRSANEGGTLPCYRRDPQSKETGALADTPMADRPGPRSLHGNRRVRSGWKREDLILSLPVRRADSELQSGKPG